MIYAHDYGFSPYNHPEQNAAALNEAVKNGGEITVVQPGIYEISETVFLHDHTHLHFADGVVIKRTESKSGKNGNQFLNSGALTGVKNTDIRITGLHLLTNNVQSTAAETGCEKTVTGLRGHIAFLYIEDLYLSDITVTDLSLKDYAIQICDFKNAVVERCHLEGLKDGIHFGPGTDFTVRDCKFRTMDDAIAINCSDYSVSNPNMGDIENGLIENCIDLKGDPTESFFLRILVGGWIQWKPGITVYHSDAVVHDGKLYRVVMHPDNEAYISNTPPTHEKGFAELDGIRWVRTHLGYETNKLPLTASCRNITLRNIALLQPRRNQVLIYASYDEYLRSYHAGFPMPEVKNITFENVQVHCKTENLIYIKTKTDSITLKNCSLNGSDIFQEQNEQMEAYPPAEIIITN